MLKLVPLVIAVSLLTACAPRPTPRPILPPQPKTVCPSWVVAGPRAKAKLADELDAAPVDAEWPTQILNYWSLQDQLQAAGCKPVNPN